MTKYVKREVGRSAVNGQFVPKAETVRRPRTTELETIRYPKKS